MDAKQWREMQLETEGHFGGLGMTVTGEGGMLKVVAPIGRLNESGFACTP